MAVGGEIQVSQLVGAAKRGPEVAINAAGDFVVAWESDGSASDDASGTSIQCRAFAADGTPQTGELQVNTSTAGDQYDPDVAMAADGSFSVVWMWQSPETRLVVARRYAAGGATPSDEDYVSGPEITTERLPVIAMKADGEHVIAWTRDNPSTSAWAVRRTADGATIRAYIIGPGVTSLTAAMSEYGDISFGFTDPLGHGLVITFDRDLDNESVHGTVPLSSPSGQEFEPAVAHDRNGDLAVVWWGTGAIGGQLYTSRALLIDGFESGGLTAWQTVVPPLP